MLKVKDLIVKVTDILPGSIGVAQVGQVTKAVLDQLAFADALELQGMLAKRRRAILNKLAPKKAKK